MAESYGILQEPLTALTLQQFLATHCQEALLTQFAHSLGNSTHTALCAPHPAPLLYLRLLELAESYGILQEPLQLFTMQVNAVYLDSMLSLSTSQVGCWRWPRAMASCKSP
jgi:hypothetical protein